MSILYNLCRKKGFEETLEIMSNFKRCKAKPYEFLNALKKKYGDLTSFSRIKDDLIKYRLILYEMTKDDERIICLTERGKELYKKIKEVNSLINKKKF